MTLFRCFFGTRSPQHTVAFTKLGSMGDDGDAAPPTPARPPTQPLLAVAFPRPMPQTGCVLPYQGPESKQLMVEAVALLGSLLLLLDRRIPGPARERSVVAYFRARGGGQVGDIPKTNFV